MTDALLKDRKIDPAMAVAIKTGAIRLFEGFPCLAGITTNSLGSFKMWPTYNPRTSDMDFGSYKDNLENHFFSANMGADFFLKLAVEHGEEIIVQSSCLNPDSRFFIGDGIVYFSASTMSNRIPMIMSNTADCPVVVIHGKRGGITATCVIHSGWRSTRANIVGKAIRSLLEDYTFDPEDVFIGLWPGICRDCYEVGEDVIDAFSGYVEDGQHLDLKDVILDQIKKGVKINGTKKIIPPSNVFTLEGCSKHTVDSTGKNIFCSHRRDGTVERNIVFITT